MHGHEDQSQHQENNPSLVASHHNSDRAAQSSHRVPSITLEHHHQGKLKIPGLKEKHAATQEIATWLIHLGAMLS
jgi:hypothetical protein